TGTTSKTTGKITYLQELVYNNIEKSSGFQTAKTYYESQKEAIRIIKRNIADNNIDCNFQNSDSYTFTYDETQIPNFKKEEAFFDKIGVKYNNKNIMDSVYAIGVKNTYVFHPIKYLRGLLEKINLADNIKVYENTCALKVKKDGNKYIVITECGIIETEKIVLACNYPFFTIPGLFPLKSYLEKSYITATNVDKTFNINGITNTIPYVSFRYHEAEEKYFLCLTGARKICDSLNTKKNYEKNVSYSKKVTGKSPSYAWMNMDVLTHDKIPLTGYYLIGEKGLLIATGYNTWGMTNGTISAKIISDLINNKTNKYIKAFSPNRQINMSTVKSFFVNSAFSSTKAYVLSFLNKNPSWYKNKAKVVKKGGKRVGIYYDKDGKEHVVLNICPHLKCFLNFNEVDKTWDCPCHGSRFDIDGNSIKGPSIYNIKIESNKN
ncbi:MAG: FAD-dependent oxidoreductase, partial [Bacilli bacterium]